MEKKEKISTRELVDRIKSRRKQPISPEFVERFNRMIESDDSQGQEESPENEKSEKKIARPPEASI